MRSQSIRLALLAVTAIAASPALADEDAMPETTHVNIAIVETAEELAPVDGIRSAGQPDTTALQLAADAGYAAVIDMRGVAEPRGMDDEAGVIESLGMDYIAMPIEDATAISFDNARKLDAMLEGIDGPVLIHCGSGNRVGALLALRESLNGASKEEALSYGQQAGLTGLQPLVEMVLNSAEAADN